MTTAEPLIRADHFPTPELALATDDPDLQAGIRAFADLQATPALDVLGYLWRAGDQATPALLSNLHNHAALWRHQVAIDADHTRQGRRQAEAYLTRVSADTRAHETALGEVGALRSNPSWDETTGVHTGGHPTPASEIAAHYGRVVRQRLDHSGADELTDTVTLPLGGTLPGVRLVRGHAAARITALRAGRDPGRAGDDDHGLVYAVAPDPQAARTMRQAAYHALAAANLTGAPEDRVAAWRTARHLLMQAPLHTRGSDAVTRVFLVATGTWLFGFAPTMQQDADLRCLTLGQDQARVMPADTDLDHHARAYLDTLTHEDAG